MQGMRAPTKMRRILVEASCNSPGWDMMVDLAMQTKSHGGTDTMISQLVLKRARGRLVSPGQCLSSAALAALTHLILHVLPPARDVQCGGGTWQCVLEYDVHLVPVTHMPGEWEYQTCANTGRMVKKSSFAMSASVVLIHVNCVSLD